MKIKINSPVICQVYESFEQTIERDAQSHAASKVAGLKLEVYH